MDCRAARQLLDFARPHAPELEKADLDALQGHLNLCAECDALSRAERRADEHLARAVKDVPMPLGLRDRLKARLREEREAWYRRWIGRGLKYLAAAAALLLGIYGVTRWLDPNPTVDKEEAARLALSKAMSSHDAASLKDWFQKEHGVKTEPPPDFKYPFLTAHYMTDYKNRTVPCLLFTNPLPDGQKKQAVVGVQMAQVLILSGRDIDLSPLGKDEFHYESYPFRVCVIPPRSHDYAYIVLYTGDLANFRTRPPAIAE